MGATAHERCEIVYNDCRVLKHGVLSVFNLTITLTFVDAFNGDKGMSVMTEQGTTMGRYDYDIIYDFIILNRCINRVKRAHFNTRVLTA